jgi:hypothetical protein
MCDEKFSEMTERVAAAAYAEFSDNDPTAEFAWWYGKDEGEPYDWRHISRDCGLSSVR